MARQGGRHAGSVCLSAEDPAGHAAPFRNQRSSYARRRPRQTCFLPAGLFQHHVRRRRFSRGGNAGCAGRQGGRPYDVGRTSTESAAHRRRVYARLSAHVAGIHGFDRCGVESTGKEFRLCGRWAAILGGVWVARCDPRVACLRDQLHGVILFVFQPRDRHGTCGAGGGNCRIDEITRRGAVHVPEPGGGAAAGDRPSRAAI
jgi:hypothetical protein